MTLLCLSSKSHQSAGTMEPLHPLTSGEGGSAAAAGRVLPSLSPGSHAFPRSPVSHPLGGTKGENEEETNRLRVILKLNVHRNHLMGWLVHQFAPLAAQLLIPLGLGW